MRYNPTLDRILQSITLLQSGKIQASAEILAEAMDQETFEQDFLDLNRDQQLAFAAIGDEDADDTSEEASDLDSDNTDDETVEEADFDEDDSDEETTDLTASPIVDRTTMMLRNLHALRTAEKA